MPVKGTGSRVSQVLAFYLKHPGEMFTDEAIQKHLGLSYRSAVGESRRILRKRGHNFTAKSAGPRMLQCFGYHSKNTTPGEPGELFVMDEFKKPIETQRLQDLLERMWGERSYNTLSAIIELNEVKYWTYNDLEFVSGSTFSCMKSGVHSICDTHGLILHKRLISHNRYEMRVVDISNVKTSRKEAEKQFNHTLLGKVFS